MKQWHMDWQQPAIDAVEKLWVDNYRNRPIGEERVGVYTQQPRQQPLTELDKLRAEMNIINDDDYADNNYDLQHFINQRPICIDCTLLEW
jgi:hypothetical protein